MFANRQKLFKPENIFMQTRVHFFYRKNMISFLIYVTATLKALFARLGSCNFFIIIIFCVYLYQISPYRLHRFVYTPLLVTSDGLVSIFKSFFIFSIAVFIPGHSQKVMEFVHDHKPLPLAHHYLGC